MNLLLIIDGHKSHYMYIKDFDRYIFNKTKTKITFGKSVYSVLVVKMF